MEEVLKMNDKQKLFWVFFLGGLLSIWTNLQLIKMMEFYSVPVLYPRMMRIMPFLMIVLSFLIKADIITFEGS